MSNESGGFFGSDSAAVGEDAHICTSVLEVIESIESEGVYRWSTDDSHANNSITMSDFIDFSLPENFEAYLIDDSYAEIINNDTKEKYSVNASGNGDFCNHKVSFGKI